MEDRQYEDWLAWSRANPEPEIEPACECESRESEQRGALAHFTPESIEAATQAIIGRKN
ncbi:MAG TPA: hypothetical protein VL094_09585 [Sphingomonadaceae bacterium]|nr:hypothetical protein [Sphingomonadaceae bacterium]